jgi:hypothetical protein
MVIKKVTVKFDSCSECPVYRYTGCDHASYDGATMAAIPGNCPIEGNSVMMNRYTEFPSSKGADIDMGELTKAITQKRDSAIHFPAGTSPGVSDFPAGDMS